MLRSLRDENEILFGIELKSWYVLSKEGEPSFSETSTDEQIGRKLQTLKSQIQADMSESEKDKKSFEYKESFSDLIQQLEDLWQKSS